MQHKGSREFVERQTLQSKKPRRRSAVKAERSEPKGSLDRRTRLGYAAMRGCWAASLKRPNFSQICVPLNGGDTKRLFVMCGVYTPHCFASTKYKKMVEKKINMCYNQSKFKKLYIHLIT